MATTVQKPISSTRRRTIFPRSASTGSLRQVGPSTTRSPKRASKEVKALLQTPIPEHDNADHMPPPEKPLKSCLSVGNKLSSLGREDSSQNKMKKSVSFHAIEIREHPRALGDHPASSGAALSLGWYTEEEGSTISLPLDDYETERPARRDRRSLSVPRRLREHILKEEAGVSLKDISVAQREAARIRQSRRVTNSTRDYDNAHYVLESVVRKFKRLMGSSKKTGKDLMEQAKRAQELQQQRPWADTAYQVPVVSAPEKENKRDSSAAEERASPSSKAPEDPPVKPKRAVSPKAQRDTAAIPKSRSDSSLPPLAFALLLGDPSIKPERVASLAKPQQDTVGIPKSFSDSFLPTASTSETFTLPLEEEEDWEF